MDDGNYGGWYLPTPGYDANVVSREVYFFLAGVFEHASAHE